MKFLLLAAIIFLLWSRWGDVQRLLNHKVRPTRPTPAEAAHVLGLEPGAGPDAVRAAHRRLIALVHPDNGGSADLARRVNAARDTLLATSQPERSPRV